MQVSKKEFEFYQPNESINGVSYPEWTSRWFKWILEQPLKDHPCFTYHHNADMQPYDKDGVWFMIGSLESVGVGPNPPNGRRETYGKKMLDNNIPPDKAVLMPIINAFRVEPRNNQKSIERAIELARQDINIINAGGMSVLIDDDIEIPNSEIAKYRVETPGVFEAVLPGRDNITTLRHVLGRKIKVVVKGDGYWLFFKPNQLSGDRNHKIRTFASCSLGKVVIDMQYRIESDKNKSERG